MALYILHTTILAEGKPRWIDSVSIHAPSEKEATQQAQKITVGFDDTTEQSSLMNETGTVVWCTVAHVSED